MPIPSRDNKLSNTCITLFIRTKMWSSENSDLERLNATYSKSLSFSCSWTLEKCRHWVLNIAKRMPISNDAVWVILQPFVYHPSWSWRNFFCISTPVPSSSSPFPYCCYICGNQVTENKHTEKSGLWQLWTNFEHTKNARRPSSRLYRLCKQGVKHSTSCLF